MHTGGALQKDKLCAYKENIDESDVIRQFIKLGLKEHVVE